MKKKMKTGLGTIVEQQNTMEYSSPQGTKFESKRGEDWVELDVTKLVDIGEPGDAAATQHVEFELRAQGRSVKKLIPDDPRIEDGLLEIDGRRIAVQVVSAPVDGDFFRKAKAGQGRMIVRPPQAAAWVVDAILHKQAKNYDAKAKKAMLLAIDFRHLGHVIDLIGPAEAQLRARADEAGFGAVWVIGPGRRYVELRNQLF